MLFSEFIKLADDEKNNEIVNYFQSQIKYNKDYFEIKFNKIDNIEDGFGLSYVLSIFVHVKYINENANGSTIHVQERISFDDLKHKNEVLFKSNLDDKELDVKNFLNQVHSIIRNLIFLDENKNDYISRKEIRNLRLKIIKREKENDYQNRKYNLRWGSSRFSIDKDIRKFLNISKEDFINCSFRFGFMPENDQIAKISCLSNDLDIKTELPIGIDVKLDEADFKKEIDLKSISSFLKRCKKIEKIEKYYKKLNSILKNKINPDDFIAKIDSNFNIELKINLSEDEIDNFIN